MNSSGGFRFGNSCVNLMPGMPILSASSSWLLAGNTGFELNCAGRSCVGDGDDLRGESQIAVV